MGTTSHHIIEARIQAARHSRRIQEDIARELARHRQKMEELEEERQESDLTMVEGGRRCE